MVDLKTGYELNHIYNFLSESDEQAAAASASEDIQEIELFDKSLALASDLKRLPIMRGGSIKFRIHRNFIPYLVGAVVVGFTARCTLYNCAANEVADRHRLGTANLYCNIVIANIDGLLVVNDWNWDYEGGVLLNPTITIVMSNGTNVAITGDALPEGMIKAEVDIEIDWHPITKKQFEEYIVESVYAKEAE